MKRRTILCAGAAGAATIALPAARAQGLPSGPIRIIVGFPPGGGTDALARILAQKLQAMWNTTIVVENKAGAAGVLAADYVAKAPADGSVLLMAHINSHAIAPGLVPKLSYVVERDFSPIVRVGVTPNLLIAWPGVQSKTVKDIVAEGKAKPGKLSFGSAGNGSAQHLALEMFKSTAKVDLLHVPYRGSGPLLTDLMGGQILYSFDTMAAATPHVKSGKVIAIAQTRISRAKAYPNLPTLHDLGYLGFDASTWYGLVGPGKLPSLYVRRMNEDVNKVLVMPDVKEKLAAVGAEDAGGTAVDFERFIATETKKWSRVIKDARVRYEG
jgi:tripartite-type tricarboxylate transporter receptor subunit TctC